jgi:hypothetical protein
MRIAAWLTLGAALLGGCAQIHWERAFYDGMRANAAQQAHRTGPQAVPQAPLPEHADYEEARRRLQRAQ